MCPSAELTQLKGNPWLLKLSNLDQNREKNLFYEWSTGSPPLTRFSNNTVLNNTVYFGTLISTKSLLRLHGCFSKTQVNLALGNKNVSLCQNPNLCARYNHSCRASCHYSSFGLCNSLIDVFVGVLYHHRGHCLAIRNRALGLTKEI